MTRFDPASFKDPAGRVFYHAGSAYRTLSEEARASFEAAKHCGLIDSLIRDQLLLETELTDWADPATAASLVSSEHAGAGNAAGTPLDHGPLGVSGRAGAGRAAAAGVLLKQPRVVPVTYSYEWSFEMLRDAARTTLQALDRALASGFVLKDANSFNVLYDRKIPKLVDVLSIEPYHDGAIWTGYAQFCRSFLFPLLLAAYRDVDVQMLLIGTMGEVPLQLTAKLLHPLDRFRPGVLKDVVLQARLERTFARAATSIGKTTASHKYPKAAFVSSVRRMLKIIVGLKAPVTPSEWSGYDKLHSYSAYDLSAKAAFVERALGDGRGKQVVDLGCNTGEYARLAIKAGARTVAVDLDSRAIDRMYRETPRGTNASLLVANLLNPSPAMGWELEERRSLLERIRSDVFLALALIHHLRIIGGVPLDRIVDQLLAIAPEGIVEWVGREDPMVQHMLSLRADVYTDYSSSNFESILQRRGRILSVESLQGGRRLYHLGAC